MLNWYAIIKKEPYYVFRYWDDRKLYFYVVSRIYYNHVYVGTSLDSIYILYI